MPTWRLEDAAQRAADFPYTFLRPTAERIAALCPGELVKLSFAFDSEDPDAPRAERMWVAVDTVDGDGGFTGTLTHPPGWISDIDLGDAVVFRDVHVCSTADDDDEAVDRYARGCIVSTRVIADRAPVGYLVREEPEHGQDSGWRLLSGEESQDELDDVENLRVVTLGEVLNLDDAWIHLLDSPVGRAFVYDAEAGAFVPVDA